MSATWLDSYSLAYTVASLLNQLFGKGKEPFWQQAYTNLVRWIIELYRVLPPQDRSATPGWVTLRDVYHCAIDKELFAKKIQEAQTYAADMGDEWITIDRGRRWAATRRRRSRAQRPRVCAATGTARTLPGARK